MDTLLKLRQRGIMQTLSTISTIGFVTFTFVSWLIWAFWITGTPKNPNFFAPTFHFWSVYRTAIQEALSRKCPRWTIRIFEWSYGSSLVCFTVMIVLFILKVLNRY
jgi:hypothetical protein